MSFKKLILVLSLFVLTAVPVFAQVEDILFEPYKMEQNEILFKQSMKNLPERERTIINLRFFVGKTQMEVANEIGISQAQVSRLEKGALKRIKNHK